MSISIFAKNPSRARSDKHLQRVSSIIRGQQIAARLHLKLNPTTGCENDACIYVKPHVKPGEDFLFEGKKSYLDIIDGWQLIPLALRCPEVAVITCSYVDFEYVSALVPNKVILIPQHHVNFNRESRHFEKINTVGCIGTKAAFPFLPDNLKEELQKRGIKLIEFSDFQKREDIINFYKQIDLQIVWRPYLRAKKIRLSNPLKLVNACSFGVPTIALDEDSFREMKGYYFPVKNFDQFLDKLDELINNENIYKEYSEKCLKKAETYHIDTIAKLYLALE